MRYFVGVCFLVCWAALGWAQDPSALARERCVSCHDMSRTCLVDSDDAQWWTSVILRMNAYQDGLMTVDEAQILGKFLAEKDKRVFLCQ